jgi:hypothetical protein
MGLERRPRPNQDTDPKAVEGHPSKGGIGREPRGVQREIAGKKPPVRNTPPAGEWNDTARNEDSRDDES